MSKQKSNASSSTSQPVQLDIFGGITPPKYEPKKAVQDTRLKDFQNAYGKYLTPYVLVIKNDGDSSVIIPEKHIYMTHTEAQKRITAMCAIYGMKRTVFEEGLVASGNGKFLYFIAIEDTNSKRKE